MNLDYMSPEYIRETIAKTTDDEEKAGLHADLKLACDLEEYLERTSPPAPTEYEIAYYCGEDAFLAGLQKSDNPHAGGCFETAWDLGFEHHLDQFVNDYDKLSRIYGGDVYCAVVQKTEKLTDSQTLVFFSSHGREQLFAYFYKRFLDVYSEPFELIEYSDDMKYSQCYRHALLVHGDVPNYVPRDVISISQNMVFNRFLDNLVRCS